MPRLPSASSSTSPPACRRRSPPRDFSTLGGKFAGAEQYLAAIDILDAGMKAHSESPELKALQDDIKAEKSGDQTTLDKLSSLGYTGGD